jgi:predicted DNA-binding transcriptional regulator AlpA
MTLQEDRVDRFENNGNRVLTFRQWCGLNGFSVATGRRLIKSGQGPSITQLSPRRIGIRLADNAAWQATRVRS